MKWWQPYYRFVAGFAMMGVGGGLVLEHLIRYGGAGHWAFPDHGTIGIGLFVAGAILTLLKPGTKAD